MDDEAPEPQRSLFSWADFMAEEMVEPKRQCPHEALTLSPVEHVLERKPERGLVGAGR